MPVRRILPSRLDIDERIPFPSEDLDLVPNLKKLQSLRRHSRYNKRQSPDAPGLAYLSPSLIAAACQKIVTPATAVGTVEVSVTSTITSYEHFATSVIGLTEIQGSFITVAQLGKRHKSASE